MLVSAGSLPGKSEIVRWVNGGRFSSSRFSATEARGELGLVMIADQMSIATTLLEPTSHAFNSGLAVTGSFADTGALSTLSRFH